MSLLLLLRPRASSSGAPATPTPAIVELTGSYVDVVELRGSVVAGVELQGSAQTVYELRLAVGDAPMAIETNITDRLFVGTDIELRYSIFEADGITPKDVSGNALAWVMRKRDKDPDPALIEKATGGDGVAIEGAFNIDPAINTQRVVVTLEDVDTDGFNGQTYRCSLRRTDAGAEYVLGYGNIPLRQAA